MRTTVNIDDDDLDAFDAVWQAEGIESRSRAVREAIQEYVERHTALESVEGDVIALVGFDYDHHEVIEDLHTVQHDYQDVIDATAHTHQGEWCMEAVFCRGPAERVRSLVYALRDFDGVRRVTVTSLAAV
ncbi:ribbon-helix-helix protein, CopG family [Haloarculaceae archaeon H-GB2-1]|nr:ribbon-helix-helix protein, CopG family [Haloarculaceae archaeon H-GB1-1]MEA5389063.1 ribbon-helix-helix protein, CopG family [Haloarculaceae archaeon H-GB11]MEA5407124.1 ribbon-helix-helix protein, CopG family [Haloarculaceae archaeon H-GB2-1]